MTGNKYILLLIAIIIFSGCKPKRPDNIMSPEKMENVLYDYHMAKAISSSNVVSGESYKKESYKNYVLEKYGINEAEFDSSLAWYSRHTKDMVDIYTNIEKRIKIKSDKVEEVLRLRENKFIKSISADTANLWGAKQQYQLTPLPNDMLLAFNEDIDTTFHLSDKIVFKANYNFINKNTKQKAITNISLWYRNDSIINYNKITTQDGTDSLVIQTSEKDNIKKLYLSVFLTNTINDSGDTLSLKINNIEFNRYHKVQNINNASMH